MNRGHWPKSTSHPEDPHSPQGTHSPQAALHLLFSATFLGPSSLPTQGTWASQSHGDMWAGATWKQTSQVTAGCWQRVPVQHPELRPRFPMGLSIKNQPVQPHKRSKTCISEVFLHNKAPHRIITGFLASKEDHGLVRSPPVPGQTTFPDGRQKPIATKVPESGPGDAPWTPRARRGSRWQLRCCSWGCSPSVLARLKARDLLLISGRLTPEVGAAPGRLFRQSLHVS